MELTFDKALYDKRALLKTAYQFTDRAYVHLSQTQMQWRVSWIPKANCAVAPEEFENELIHQALRLQLAQESADIRRVLLARAMASTLIELPAEEKVEPDAARTSDEEAREILKGWYEHDV